MRSTCPNLERFIRRLHRRMVLLRAVEWGGIGALIGGVFAIILYAAAVYRGQSIGLTGSLLIATAVAAGAAWGILRRPGPIHAAIQADRQLALAELLSSAWLICTKDQSTSEVVQAVLALAEQRCARLAPADVILHRLGRRTWAGVALICTLSVTLGLMSANPVESPALARVTGADVAKGRTQASLIAASGQRNTSIRRTSSTIGQPDVDEGGFDRSRNTSISRSSGGPGQGTDMANAQGTGPGAGRSNPKGGDTNLTPGATSAIANNGTGQAIAGTGASSSSDPARAASSGAVAGQGLAHGSSPVWQSSTWAAFRQQADIAVREGRVPPEYLDLVSKYFDRQ